MLNKISNYISKITRGAKFQLGSDLVQWKKVSELTPGVKIAVANQPDITWDEIVSITRLPTEQVYDIEVEGTHNFVANGIVVHNTTGKALTILNETGDQNILVASASGVTQFTLSRTGDGTFVGDVAVNGGDLTTTATTFNLLNATATTLNIGGAATTLALGATTGTTTIANDLTIGNAITDNITFTGRVAVDSDLIPIGTTGTNDLGASALPWDNLYVNNVVVPTTGTGQVGYWTRSAGVLSPAITNDAVAATTSATVAMTITQTGAFNALLVEDAASDTTPFVIDQSGNVGIGTAGPNNKLEVWGPNNTGIEWVIGAKQNYNTDATGYGTGLKLLTGYTTEFNKWAGIAAVAESGFSNTTGLALYANAAEKVRITNAGNVGIGTTGPSGKLDILVDAADGTTKPLVIGKGTSNYVTILNNGNVGIGTITPTAKLHVEGAVTGKALAILNETGDQNILVASASGVTQFTLSRSGDGTFVGDVAVNGGDLTTTAAAFNVANAATTLNLGSTDVTRTINIGTGANADTINIGTGATNADTLTFGNTGVATTFDFNTGAASVDAFDMALNSLTTGLGFDIDANALTTGTVFDIASTSTALTSGRLVNLDWSPGTSTTATGDLFRLNIGANGTTTGNLFDIEDAGTSLFSVSEVAITSALPHSFTAAGDVSVAYDLVFTNQTASYLKSNAPLTIEAGESFENNNLTLRTYGTGQIVTDSSFNGTNITSRDDETTTSTNTITGRGMVYYLHADSNTTNLSFTTTYNITGVPDTYGTVLFINSVAEKGISAGVQTHTVEVKINSSTAINTVATANGTAASTVKESYTVVRSYDGWKIVGAAGSSDSADYSEQFLRADDVGSAEVVAISAGEALKVERGSTANIDRVLGVTSTSPAFTIGEEFATDTSKISVALAGRVPVKIANSSAPILVGDALTASNEPGKAVKATRPGRTIGKALETWTPNTGQQTVLMFIENSWSDPGDFLAFDDQGNLTISGSVTAQQINSSQITNLETLLSQNTSDVSNLQLSLQGLQSQIASVSAQLASLQLQSDLGATLSADLWEIATESGRLATAYEIQAPGAFFTGPVHIGLLTIDDLSSTLSSLLGEITIDGDLAVTGAIRVLGDSAGKDILPAGATELVITSSAATPASKFFVTPEDSPVPIAASPQGSGQFVVRIPAALSQDLTVNWWVIN